MPCDVFKKRVLRCCGCLFFGGVAFCVLFIVVHSAVYAWNSQTKLVGLKEIDSRRSPLPEDFEQIQALFYLPGNPKAEYPASSDKLVFVGERSLFMDNGFSFSLPTALVFVKLSPERDLLYCSWRTWSKKEHNIQVKGESHPRRMCESRLDLFVLDSRCLQIKAHHVWPTTFSVNFFNDLLLDFDSQGNPFGVICESPDYFSLIHFDTRLNRIKEQKLEVPRIDAEGEREINWLTVGGDADHRLFYFYDGPAKSKLRSVYWNTDNDLLSQPSAFDPDEQIKEEIRNKLFFASDSCMESGSGRSRKRPRIQNVETEQGKRTIIFGRTNAMQCIPAINFKPLNHDFVLIRDEQGREIASIRWPHSKTGITAATIRNDGKRIITIHRDGKLREFQLIDGIYNQIDIKQRG